MRRRYSETREKVAGLWREAQAMRREGSPLGTKPVRWWMTTRWGPREAVTARWMRWSSGRAMAS